MSKRLGIHQWQIVQGSTLMLGTIFVLILLTQGMKEDSFRFLIRLTARSSCILFLLAFMASTLQKLKPCQAFRWLVQNRRYLGLSMAISHGFHGLAIAGVAVLTSENLVRDNFGANLGYGFIFLMTITSFPRPAAILGRNNWKILHTLGMYYLWLSFTIAFGKRIAESWLFYLPWVIILIAALILRLAVIIKPTAIKPVE